jgi:hypothetical protein
MRSWIEVVGRRLVALSRLPCFLAGLSRRHRAQDEDDAAVVLSRKNLTLGCVEATEERTPTSAPQCLGVVCRCFDNRGIVVKKQ